MWIYLLWYLLSEFISSQSKLAFINKNKLTHNNICCFHFCFNTKANKQTITDINMTFNEEKIPYKTRELKQNIQYWTLYLQYYYTLFGLRNFIWSKIDKSNLYQKYRKYDVTNGRYIILLGAELELLVNERSRSTSSCEAPKITSPHNKICKIEIFVFTNHISAKTILWQFILRKKWNTKLWKYVLAKKI